MTTIVVSGPIANKPGNGGIVWNELSYVLGLKRLGFDVHFWEQIGRGACIGPDGRPSDFLNSANLDYFKKVTEGFGMASRSALILEDEGHIYGADLGRLEAVADEAALLININGHLRYGSLRSRLHRAVYVDEDPGYTQFWQVQQNPGVQLAGHQAFYTVGANIGTNECSIPCAGIEWRPIRQPVVLDEWPVATDESWNGFSTVASWRGAFGPVEFLGLKYGLKVHEFRKFGSLPGLTGQRFSVALDIHPGDVKDRQMMLDRGWTLVDPAFATADPSAFRSFVRQSSAEFSVAQGVYVDTNSGWFSDRSARYLASGKPVLLQDTGFSRTLPVGEGLVGFKTLEEAAAGANAIARDYEEHSEAARAIAEAYFDSDKVLGALLEDMGVSP